LQKKHRENYLRELKLLEKKFNSCVNDGSHDAEKPEATTTNNVEEDAD
jgi:hypothetical protein